MLPGRESARRWPDVGASLARPLRTAPPEAEDRFRVSRMSYNRLRQGAWRPVSLAVFAVLAGCVGTIDRRTAPDAPDAVGGANLRSLDIEVMTNEMARSLASFGILEDTPNYKSSFYVLPLVNESSDTINTSLLTTELRTQLFKQLGRRVKIVDRSSEAELVVDRERKMKRRGEVTANPDLVGQKAGSDYVLKGKIQDRVLQGNRLRSAYYVVTFELTNLETSELAWTDSYKAKFESEKSVISR